ncbi:c-type cytochrome [Roseivirga sp.]|uniref:c-type cytochrome n=1 Tax=Roseivirga sp. TaxID=1964215 RepID=UPI003B51DCF0
MKRASFLLSLLSALLIFNCSGKKDQTDSFDITKSKPGTETAVKASERVDLENKGVGPITELVLPEEIDQEMAKTGEGIFKQSCAICHRPTDKFIGPAPKGVLDRRSPEWVMNMILNPGRMLRDDPLAKDLFMEFNGSPMSDMGLSEEQARAVLEYFRTI